MKSKKRRGFALISVLWFLAGVTSLSLASMLLARGALVTSFNRLALTRAEWRAEECIARSRSAMMANRRPGEAGSGSEDPIAYRDGVLSSWILRDCPGVVSLEPVGAALDVNAAGVLLLQRLFRQHGIPAATADSLVDVLLDWRDDDDSSRALGAEHEWYASRGEPAPRNDHFASVDELRLVRGFDAWMSRPDADNGIERLLSVEVGRVLIGAAPTPLVAALPGLSASDAVALEMRRLGGGAPFPELLGIMGILTVESQQRFQQAFGELSEIATVRQEGWILRATSSGDFRDPHAPNLRVTIELRLVPDGQRLAVARRRIWS